MNASTPAMVKELKRIVGNEYVFTDTDTLKRYGSDHSFVNPQCPLLIVRPHSSAEVKEIILLANQQRITVVPFSSGTTLQGAHIPATGDAITLDLSSMNKIHLLDPISRNAILEPGVTFAQLQNEAKKEGMRVLTAPGIPDTASVIATYLEHTPLFSWSKYGPWETLTMEIVLPSGEVMGTGQMAIKNTPYPYTWTTPFAVVNRMFLGAQGTLGVVTKAAITLKTLHPEAKVVFVRSDNLYTLATAMRHFLRIEAAEEMFAANPHYIALLLARTWPDEFITLKTACSPWTLVMVVRGEKEEVEVKLRDMQDVALSLNLTLEETIPGISDAAERVVHEIAFPRGFLNQNRYKGAWNPIFCYTTLNNLITSFNLVSSLIHTYKYPAPDLGCFILPLNHGATFYFEPSFYRDPSNERESIKIKNLFLEASHALIEHGAFFDRPYPLWAPLVYARTPIYHQKIKEIKNMLDPHNIMNPGKLALG